ncbi:MAG: prepilin peptidase [Thermodesulfobacteriota bacterium]
MEIFLNFFIIFVLGAAVGSFLNVVILRLPEPGESIVYPPSHCPKCKKLLRWYDNIPILSYFFLKGKCRNCLRPISWQYPAVELLAAVLALMLWVFYPWHIFIIRYIFVCLLLVVIWIDIRHQIIPDLITIPGILFGLCLAFLDPVLYWLDSALGIIIGGGIFYLVALSYYLLTKRQGMGGGDIKFVAMIGAFLGWQSLPFVIFASSLMGSLVGLVAMVRQKKGGRTVVPYGPFLASAALLYIFFEKQIIFFLWAF